MEEAVGVQKESWQATWYNAGPVEFAAFGDRLLVVEDEFRSGYECSVCSGKGKVSCAECGGNGRYTRENRTFKCSTCEGKAVMTCAACDGKGGILVVPDVSQRRPSTGKVVSVGDKVKYFAAGQDVLYSNFAGHAMDLDRAGMKVVLRILHETEILAQVKGHLELRSVRGQKDSLGV